MARIRTEEDVRNLALIELDMEYARMVLPGLSSDEVRLAAMHKARYEILSMPPELRHESRAWLEKFGFTRWRQIPWPPAGELPE